MAVGFVGGNGGVFRGKKEALKIHLISECCWKQTGIAAARVRQIAFQHPAGWGELRISGLLLLDKVTAPVL